MLASLPSLNLRQVVLQMRSNAVAWNPQEPMNFVCANEDTNLYTFDLRNLNQVSVKLLCKLNIPESFFVVDRLAGGVGLIIGTSFGVLPGWQRESTRHDHGVAGTRPDNSEGKKEGSNRRRFFHRTRRRTLIQKISREKPVYFRHLANSDTRYLNTCRSSTFALPCCLPSFALCSLPQPFLPTRPRNPQSARTPSEPPGLDDPQGPRVCGDGRVLLADGAGVRERVVRSHRQGVPAPGRALEGGLPHQTHAARVLRQLQRGRKVCT